MLAENENSWIGLRKTMLYFSCLGRLVTTADSWHFLFQFGLLQEPFDRPTLRGYVLSKRQLRVGLIERLFVVWR
jgi:hypothetical protein